MSSSPALPDPANDASAAPVSQRDEDAQYYRQVLHELVEIGTRLARAIDRQAAAAPATTPEQAGQPAPAAAPAAAPDLTIAFDRVARTLRRTIALARKLSEPAQPSPAARAAAGAEQRRRAARKQIIREVEDTIHREAHGREAEAEALHAELYERLDTLDLDDDLDTMPIAEIVAALRRDLGIAAHINSRGISPWKRRTPADVRDLCARAAQPRSAQPRSAQPRTAQPRTGDPRPLSAPPRAPGPAPARRHPDPAPRPRRETARGGQDPGPLV